MEPWLSFYEPHFASVREAKDFVQSCECLHPSAPNHIVKIMMHQAQRLVSIADDLPRIRPRQEGLQVLLRMMCSENIAKLHDRFEGEGKSRYYVQQFFKKFLSESDKRNLSYGFALNTDGLPSIGFPKAVDLLYKIRCSVAHEGSYHNFAFHDGRSEMVNTNPNVIAKISLVQVRGIVVRGCINAAKDEL